MGAVSPQQEAKSVLLFSKHCGHTTTSLEPWQAALMFSCPLVHELQHIGQTNNFSDPSLSICRLALGAHWHLPLCSKGQQEAASHEPTGMAGGEGEELEGKESSCSAAQEPSNLGTCASSPLIQDDLSIATLVAKASTQGMGVRLLVAILLEVIC